MQINYFGIDPKFFLRAFSDLENSGPSYTFALDAAGFHGVLKQEKYGTTTLITQNFSKEPGGALLVSDIAFFRKDEDGPLSATFTDVGWTIGELLAAADSATSGDFSQAFALFNSEDKLILDGSSSTTGIVSKGLLDPRLTAPFEIRASDFDDRLEGGRGDDFILAGSGDDTVNGGSGADFINGGDGNDILRGGSAKVNGTDSNVIHGVDGDDLIKGENGRDTLDGGAGSDTVFGLDGNDVLYGDTGADDIYGGSGRDKITGGAGVDRIYGGLGADKMNGGKHDDELYGGAKADKLLGGAGGDLLIGGKGRDVITGGTGNDFLSGEGGSDVFVFNAGVNEGTDHIMDFTNSRKNNKDTIKIVDGTADDVSFASSGDGDTTITLASGTQIIIEGVDVSNIGLDDINFV